MKSLDKLIVISLRQQLVSKILMNAADNGIIAAKNHFNCSVADAIYRKKNSV